jgi:hypothetical protein
MQAHYFLSKFYMNEQTGIETPVCSAYGARYHCPTHPEPDGWAIVQMLSTPMQMQAAKEDPRVLCLPLLFDPSPVADIVIETYASWGAVTGMSLGALLGTLAAIEPVFAKQL